MQINVIVVLTRFVNVIILHNHFSFSHNLSRFSDVALASVDISDVFIEKHALGETQKQHTLNVCCMFISHMLCEMNPTLPHFHT